MPPYVTPPIGEDAPEEMQKEADRIYKRLREEQYHDDTPEDKAAAAGTMWTILKHTWEKRDGKWVRKEKTNTAVTNAEEDDPEGNWITINGEHILIKDGETVERAFKRTTGKSLSGGSSGSEKKGDDGRGDGKGGETKEPQVTNDHKEYDTQLVKAMEKSSNKRVGDATAVEVEKSLTDHMAYAKAHADELENYTGQGYSGINSELREDSGKPVNARTIASIDKAIAGAPDLPEGTVLYRGVGERSMRSMKDMKPGDTCNDKAFQSFSTSPFTAHSFSSSGVVEGEKGQHNVIMRAVTSGGQKGFVVGGSEHEIIMPRGTGWKVVSNNAITTGANAGRITTHVITVVPA